MFNSFVLYLSVFVVSLLIGNRLRLKHLLYILIAVLLIDVLIMIINTSSSTQIHYRMHSIIGDRAFEADFMSGVVLFLITTYLLYKQNTIESLIMLTSVFIGSSYLLILKSRTGLLSAFIGVTFLILLIIYLTWDKNKQNKWDKDCRNKDCDSENGAKIKYWSNIVFKPMYKIFIIITIISASVIFSNNIDFKTQEDRPNLSKTVSSIFDNNFHSNKIRFLFWDASINMFLDNPIYGVGSGKWTGTFPKYEGSIFNDENVDVNSSIYAHNDYLEMLAEYGVFGILYAVFIFTGIYKLWVKSLKDKSFIPYLIIAVGFSITSFFNFTKENAPAMSLFMVALGIGYSSSSEFRIMNSKFHNKYSRHIKTFFLVIGVLMLCTGIWFKVMSYLNEKVYLEAMSLKAQKKYGEMLVKLDEVSDYFYPVDMNKMPVDFYRGVGYFELKQYDKALDKFRNAREFMKYYPTVMNNEASALYMTGSYKEAEDRYLEIKNLFPNYIEPQINLLSLYTNLNKITEAKNIITEIEKKPFDGKYVKNYSVFLEIKNYLIEKQNL